MVSHNRSQRVKNAAAFTLVELVLAVALMLLLAGAVILGIGSLDSHSRLEEGASQVETLFRYARAQSANTGRQVRIVFSSEKPVPAGTDSQTNLPPPSAPSTNLWVQMVWEPDPVGAPGRFEAFPGADLLVEQVNDLVKVQAVGQPGTVSSNVANLALSGPLPLPTVADTNDVASTDVGAATNAIPPLTCYPDGSSDSMEILLAPADGEDPRLALVTLSGITGRARYRILSPGSDGSSSSDQDAADDGWFDQ